MRRRSPRRSRAGMTLLEAVISLAVFATGVAALFGMINNVLDANQSLAFNNNALDLYTRISAQIRDARCEYDANDAAFPIIADPGLNVLGAWVTAPAAGSAITALGVPTDPVMQDYVPAMIADYRVTDATPAAGLGAQPPPTLLIEVRIRQVMGDVAKDDPNLENAPWIRNYPVQKLCAPNYDSGLSRGAFF